MASSNAVVFLSGRVTALVLLVAVQILIVRLLEPLEYARFAIALGIFALLQTALSFGIPKVITQALPRAGWSIANRTARKLVLALLALRLAGSAAALLIGLAVAIGFGLFEMPSLALLAVGSAFVLIAVLQLDLDQMAQSLALQRISRKAIVGEAVARLGLLAAGAALGTIHSATAVLAVSAATTLITGAILLWAVLRRLAEPDHGSEVAPLDRAALKAAAVGGYVSSAAWFATSPAVIRLVGGNFLAVQPFAAFSFAQALVMSIQRYTPAAMLLPFIEPSVIRSYARTGDQLRLESALSLLVKIDMLVIGAGVVVTSICGSVLIDWITAGKYGAYAYAVPFLLIYIGTNSLYRSLEIAAITLGTGTRLSWMLAISACWPIAVALLAARFGLIALLICPITDALVRMGIVGRLIRAHDARHVVDVPVVAALAALIALLSVGGYILAQRLGDAWIAVALAALAAIAFLSIALAIRPFRRREIDPLNWGNGDRFARLARPLTRT